MVRTRSKKANKISEDDDLDQKSEKSQSKLKKVGRIMEPLFLSEMINLKTKK